MKQHIVFPGKITDGGMWRGRSSRPSPSIAPIRYYFTHHKVKVPESVLVPSQSHRHQEAWNTRGCMSSREFTCENVFPRRPSSPERTHGFVIALSVPQRSWRDLICSSFLTVAQILTFPAVPPDGCHSRAVAENICTSGWECLRARDAGGPMERLSEGARIEVKKRWGHIITSSGSFIYMLLTIQCNCLIKIAVNVHLGLEWTSIIGFLTIKMDR